MAQDLSLLSAEKTSATLEALFQRLERILSITAADFGLAPKQNLACNDGEPKA